MGTNRNTKEAADVVPVQFRAPRELVESFRAVLTGEERTLSQDLRHYMARRVEDDLASEEAA